MPNPPYRRTPGYAPGPEQMARLAADAERLSRMTPGGGSLAVGESMGQRQLFDVAPRGFWARLGTRNATTGYYPFTRVDDSGGTYPDLTGTEAGDGTAASVPCFEVGGSTAVASGTKVWLQPNALGAGYTFAAAGGGGSVTLREVDGTPSFPATVLSLNQADGLQAVDSGGGVGRINILPTGIGQAGIVSLTSQDITGEKTFYSTAFFANGYPGGGAVNNALVTTGHGIFGPGGTETDPLTKVVVNGGFNAGDMPLSVNGVQQFKPVVLDVGGVGRFATDVRACDYDDENTFVAIGQFGTTAVDARMGVEFLDFAETAYLALGHYNPGGSDQSLITFGNGNSGFLADRFGHKDFVGATVSWGITGTHSGLVIKGGVVTGTAGAGLTTSFGIPDGSGGSYDFTFTAGLLTGFVHSPPP